VELAHWPAKASEHAGLNVATSRDIGGRMLPAVFTVNRRVLPGSSDGT
jgi:hypothetical protein